MSRAAASDQTLKRNEFGVIGRRLQVTDMASELHI
jgi:hypothetical protein